MIKALEATHNLICSQKNFMMFRVEGVSISWPSLLVVWSIKKAKKLFLAGVKCTLLAACLKNIMTHLGGGEGKQFMTISVSVKHKKRQKSISWGVKCTPLATCFSLIFAHHTFVIKDIAIFIKALGAIIIWFVHGRMSLCLGGEG